MKRTRMVVVGALAAVLSAASAQAGLDDLFKSAEGMLKGGSSDSASLSNSQISAGLKEALGIGAERAIEILGQSGGYLNDKSVRIPLPGVLGKAAKALRAAGQGEYVDEFETTVNRAAEQAIPKTLDIVKETVTNMTLDDVRGILNGPDDAATQFLRNRAGGSLHKAILPIVAQATDNAGATSAYKSLKKEADDMMGGFGSLLDTGSLDLDNYVTDKALDGLFLKLALEEKRIRENPVARSTELLKQVFGN